MFHIHLHNNSTIIRRTSGRILGAVKESSALTMLGITVCLSVHHTVVTSSLMLFEGQAGEALERSGFLSYRFPVEVKVSRVCLVTFLSTYSFIHSIRPQTQIDTAGTNV
jgi:hypothetical protein